MNQLNIAKRLQIIAALVEGNSINATCRMLGIALQPCNVQMPD